jgi:hypothetical protein
MRIRCVAAVIAGTIWCLAAPAHADPRTEIAAKTKAAMASYDAMDYEAARRQLNQALAIAKKARLDKDPIVARVYLDLGITQLAGSDPEAARVALLSAAQIDPRIAIDAAYRSPELVKLLDEAKAAAGDGPEPSPDVDCKAVRGLRHVAVDAGRPGAPQPIEVLIGGDISPSRVAVMYRPEGAIDFAEVRLTRQSGCRYAGTIPGSAMRGSLVHYYIAAYDAANRVLASKGSSGAPNVLELRERRELGDAPGDPEDPITAPRSRGPASAEVTEGTAAARKSHRAMVALAGGTGLGYVTGRTEGDNRVQKCCIGSSPVVTLVELGYYTSPRLSLGFAARIGFPIGANIAGHSTIAPAGFLRARYALSSSSSGDGFRIMAGLGAGVLRNTIKLDNMPGMDTDVVAQGPLLLGAGVGYLRHITDSLAFLVDLDAIAGIAIVSKVGSAVHLNSGISADMRFGVALVF